MRRLVGGLLFFLGLVGLVLTLTSWLPIGMNVVIVVFVCLFCLGCVWGGGKLLQQPAVSGRPVPGGFAARSSVQRQFMAVCPRCGWWISSGQRFCGGCGMTVGLVCSRCGAMVAPGFKFCTNCGGEVAQHQ